MDGVIGALTRSPQIIVGLGILILVTICALFAPWVATHDPFAIAPSFAYAPPGSDHWMGTDNLGRDVFSRMVYASRISMAVGFVAVGVSSAIGLVLGSISGYYGGWADTIIMRGVDIMLTIPTLFLILAVVTFLEPSIFNIMLIIGLTGWMGSTRLVRAEILRTKQSDYVQSARVLGASDARIIARHVLPNSIAPLLVSATLGIASAILVESGLSFLGLGVQPPTPSWGNMLTSGTDTLEYAWWISVFPGIAILLTVLAFNLVGEAIRDHLDPKTR